MAARRTPTTHAVKSTTRWCPDQIYTNLDYTRDPDAMEYTNTKFKIGHTILRLLRLCNINKEGISDPNLRVLSLKLKMMLARSSAATQPSESVPRPEKERSRSWMPIWVCNEGVDCRQHHRTVQKTRPSQTLWVISRVWKFQLPIKTKQTTLP